MATKRSTPRGKPGGAQGGRPTKKTPSKTGGAKGAPKFTPTASFKASAAEGKKLLETSYNTGAARGPEQKAVMDWYASLPRAKRMAQYVQIANAVKNRDFTNWSNPFYSVLHGDLPTEARAAYSTARGNAPRGSMGGVTAPPGGMGSFAYGVSGATGAFIKEEGMAGPAGEESEAGETGPTKRRRKGKTQKLVKRTTKKTNVKGKAIRKALRSPGVTAKDKKVYKRVAKQAPKLSSRLRAADRKKK